MTSGAAPQPVERRPRHRIGYLGIFAIGRVVGVCGASIEPANHFAACEPRSVSVHRCPGTIGTRGSLVGA